MNKNRTSWLIYPFSKNIFNFQIIFFFLIVHTFLLYDYCTYFQSINKIVQSFLAVTSETFQCTFLVPQNRVYTQKQFYFKNIKLLFIYWHKNIHKSDFKTI